MKLISGAIEEIIRRQSQLDGAQVVLISQCLNLVVKFLGVLVLEEQAELLDFEFTLNFLVLPYHYGEHLLLLLGLHGYLLPLLYLGQLVLVLEECLLVYKQLSEDMHVLVHHLKCATEFGFFSDVIFHQNFLRLL